MKAMKLAEMPPCDDEYSATGLQVVVGEWGILELATNPFADFAKGISAIRATYTMDVAVRHAGAFSVATSIT